MNNWYATDRLATYRREDLEREAEAAALARTARRSRRDDSSNDASHGAPGFIHALRRRHWTPRFA